MRLVTYDAGEGPCAGRLDGDAVVPLSGPGEGGLGALLRRGLAGATDRGESLPLVEVTLLPPVPDPAKIVCIGLNYRSHAEEAGLEPPERPSPATSSRPARPPGWAAPAGRGCG